jgi:hypothetical protein
MRLTFSLVASGREIPRGRVPEKGNKNNDINGSSLLAVGVINALK